MPVMSEITMPKLSDSMEEGTILSWLKRDGEQVLTGEDLVEIETDKATITHPAGASGILRIMAAEGASLPVGAPIADIGGGDAAAVARGVSVAANAETVIGPAAVMRSAAIASPVNGRAGRGAGRATPLARRVAEVHGVALADVQGSGPQGRITRADVLTRAGLTVTPSPLPGSPETPAAPAAPAAAPKRGAGTQQLTRVQQVIARRMAEANTTVPHFQVQTEVAMDEAIALRAQLKTLSGDDPAPSFNDIIVKAAAVALRAFPLANGSYTSGALELHDRVNIGVAVAAEAALAVPTVFDADVKSLGQISRDVRRLAALVRDGRIGPAELGGGTFTVSNLGMFGMTAITPIINVPQAAILGVGAMRPVLQRVDGEIVDRTLMTLTLSCDHRILYGADAARFLAHVRDLLQAPLGLAL
jgi:pyruvate dehydrogenase E2 component (dihydrolipoamide acetyltransferase)